MSTQPGAPGFGEPPALRELQARACVQRVLRARRRCSRRQPRLPQGPRRLWQSTVHRGPSRGGLQRESSVKNVLPQIGAPPDTRPSPPCGPNNGRKRPQASHAREGRFSLRRHTAACDETAPAAAPPPSWRSTPLLPSSCCCCRCCRCMSHAPHGTFFRPPPRGAHRGTFVRPSQPAWRPWNLLSSAAARRRAAREKPQRRVHGGAPSLLQHRATRGTNHTRTRARTHARLRAVDAPPSDSRRARDDAFRHAIHCIHAAMPGPPSLVIPRHCTRGLPPCVISPLVRQHRSRSYGAVAPLLLLLLLLVVSASRALFPLAARRPPAPARADARRTLLRAREDAAVATAPRRRHRHPRSSPREVRSRHREKTSR